MDEFDSQEVLQYAKENAQAMTLVSLAYVTGKGLPADEYVSFVSEKFALAWEALKDKGALEVMRMFALNMVSVGGTLESVSGDGERAEAVVSGWPSRDMLETYGVDQVDADRTYGVFGSIARLLDLSYEWRRQGDRVTLVLSK